MSKTKVRVLEGVNFDGEDSHISYTTPADGGAASLLNEPFLLKKLNIEDSSSETDSQALACDKTPEEGDITKTQKKETLMTDNVSQADFLALKRELAVQKSQNKLIKYGLDAELTEALSGAVASLSDEKEQEAVFKALDTLVAAKEEVVAKAQKPEAENPLAKALDEEAGETGEPEVEVEKTFLDRIKAHQGEK